MRLVGGGPIRRIGPDNVGGIGLVRYRTEPRSVMGGRVVQGEALHETICAADAVGQRLGQRGDGELLLIAQKRADCPQGLPDKRPGAGRCVRLCRTLLEPNLAPLDHWLCQPYGIREDRRGVSKAVSTKPAAVQTGACVNFDAFMELSSFRPGDQNWKISGHSGQRYRGTSRSTGPLITPGTGWPWKAVGDVDAAGMTWWPLLRDQDALSTQAGACS